MPSNSASSTLLQRATSTRNVIILTAIAVAIPAAFAFHDRLPGDQAGFLLLFAVAVGVPSALDSYGPQFQKLRNCVFATVWLCSAVLVAYVVSFTAGVDFLSLPPFLAGVIAFLVGYFGAFGILAVLSR